MTKRRWWVTFLLLGLCLIATASCLFWHPGKTGHQFLAGPGNSIIHLQTRSKEVFQGLGATHPVGIPGPRYEQRVTRSRLEILPSPAAGGGQPSPLELRYPDGRPFVNDPKNLPGQIQDLAVNGDGRLLVSVDCSPEPLLLPVRVENGEFTPPTFRSQVVQMNYLWSDLPLHLDLSAADVGLSVTPFGLVEFREDGEIIRHEWAPDREGCFTRWWQHSKLDRFRFSRYRPPFPFDSIDRQATTVGLKEKELVTLRRWSGRAFLYRKEGKVTGVYWPDLRYRRGANEENPIRFIDIFGRFDARAETVSELIAVDDQGGVWRFSEVGPYFSVRGEVNVPTLPIMTPRIPNEWLHHRVSFVDQVLDPGHPEGLRAPGG